LRLAPHLLVGLGAAGLLGRRGTRPFRIGREVENPLAIDEE